MPRNPRIEALESGKDEETETTLEPPEGAQSRQHLGFSSVRLLASRKKSVFFEVTQFVMIA